MDVVIQILVALVVSFKVGRILHILRSVHAEVHYLNVTGLLLLQGFLLLDLLKPFVFFFLSCLFVVFVFIYEVEEGMPVGVRGNSGMVVW